PMFGPSMFVPPTDGAGRLHRPRAPASRTGRPQRPNRPRISLSIIPIRKNPVEKAAAAGRECSRRVELCMKFAAYVGWKATIPTTRRKTENQGGSFVVEGCRPFASCPRGTGGGSGRAPGLDGGCRGIRAADGRHRHPRSADGRLRLLRRQRRKRRGAGRQRGQRVGTVQLRLPCSERG